MRSLLLLALTLTLWSPPGPTPLAAAEARRPNILLIVADDLGYGELGLQGNPQIPTPNIDSLATHGIRFTSGYVSGPYCSPTRAGLQTGRYQQRYGHEFNPGPAQAASQVFGLSLKETTIGNRLKDLGYATGWFGKSHLGYLPPYHPLQRGYDEYLGFLGGAHDYLDAAADGHNPLLRGTNRVDSIDYTTDAFGREAVRFIQAHRDQPWFVYLPFNAVHAPLESTPKYLGRFDNLTDRKRRTFAAMLSAMDDAVGSVLATLRPLGQEEDTLIFFLSDNGGPTGQTTSGNGPLRGFKAQTWEGGIRIPFVIQWKGHLPAGRVDHRPVIQLDILPTALAAAGATIKPEWKLDGVNLLPFLAGGQTNPPHDALYWRFGGQMAIRQGDWKLVKAPGAGANPESWGGSKATVDGAELYNLAGDVGERTNLAASEPGKVRELAAAWNAWNAGLVEPAWRPGPRAAAARAGATPTTGPWKSGDTVAPAQAPRIANRALRITAEVEPSGPEGVVVAQGAAGNGFAIYLKEGRAVFAVRSRRTLTTITAATPLPAARCRIEASLAADGAMAIRVDDRVVAEGRAPGLIAAQPAFGLTVGRGDTPVGSYQPPALFSGRVGNVTVR